MNFIKRILPIFLVIVLCFSGCGKNNQSKDELNSSTPSDISFAENDDEMFTERDKNSAYDESSAVKITLNGNSATASSNTVKISGSSIKITQEATYIISGSLNNGTIIVDAPQDAKLQLVLKGVSIKSETSAPLYIIEADKVVVTLAENTNNTLENGGNFSSSDDENIDGTIFSKQDLSFNGKGSLTVTSPSGHGIVCKDDLVFTGGSYIINSAWHAIDANDSVRTINTTISADLGKDAIHAENNDDTSLGFVYISNGSYTFESEGDGISAAAFLQINDGTFNITAGGGSENGTKQNSGNYGNFIGGGGMGDRPGGMGNKDSQTSTSLTNQTDDAASSMKGLKSTGNMQISGGTFTINSADDAVHTNTSLYIKGGTITASTGDDGFHAKETLEISSGKLNISECYEGIEALNIKISGGDITLTASDDGLNAAGGTDQSGFGGRDNENFGGQMGGGGMSSGNGSIVISGGTLNITASGDGLDANGTLEITGGYTIVCGPTQGNTATLDYDKTGTISGGTFIGTGASGMAQSFSDSAQGVIAVSVSNISANTEIVLKDSSGKTILTHKPTLNFAVIILSDPNIYKGKTYVLTVGENSSEFEAN